MKKILRDNWGVLLAVGGINAAIGWWTWGGLALPVESRGLFFVRYTPDCLARQSLAGLRTERRGTGDQTSVPFSLRLKPAAPKDLRQNRRNSNSELELRHRSDRLLSARFTDQERRV